MGKWGREVEKSLIPEWCMNFHYLVINNAYKQLIKILIICFWFVCASDPYSSSRMHPFLLILITINNQQFEKLIVNLHLFPSSFKCKLSRFYASVFIFTLPSHLEGVVPSTTLLIPSRIMNSSFWAFNAPSQPSFWIP